MLQQTPGTWYVDTRLFNSTWEPGLTLRFSSFMTKCLYWHTERETWTSDGCQASFFVAFFPLCSNIGTYRWNSVSGGGEKHCEASTVPVQPPHPVWELLLCDAKPCGHISHGRVVCHRVSQLRCAGLAVRFLRPLPDHSAVGLLC